MNFKHHRFFAYGVNALIVAVTMISVLSTPVALFLSGLGDQIKFFDSSLLMFLIISQFFFVAQFNLACFAIRKRFVALNNYLNKSNTKTECKKFGASCVMNENFCKSYFKLCEVIEIVNETFTFPLIFIYGFFMVSTI